MTTESLNEHHIILSNRPLWYLNFNIEKLAHRHEYNQLIFPEKNITDTNQASKHNRNFNKRSRRIIPNLLQKP